MTKILCKQEEESKVQMIHAGQVWVLDREPESAIEYNGTKGLVDVRRFVPKNKGARFPHYRGVSGRNYCFVCDVLPGDSLDVLTMVMLDCRSGPGDGVSYFIWVATEWLRRHATFIENRPVALWLTPKDLVTSVEAFYPKLEEETRSEEGAMEVRVGQVWETTFDEVTFVDVVVALYENGSSVEYDRRSGPGDCVPSVGKATLENFLHGRSLITEREEAKASLMDRVFEKYGSLFYGEDLPKKEVSDLRPLLVEGQVWERKFCLKDDNEAVFYDFINKVESTRVQFDRRRGNDDLIKVRQWESTDEFLKDAVLLESYLEMVLVTPEDLMNLTAKFYEEGPQEECTPEFSVEVGQVYDNRVKEGFLRFAFVKEVKESGSILLDNRKGASDTRGVLSYSSSRFLREKAVLISDKWEAKAVTPLDLRDLMFSYYRRVDEFGDKQEVPQAEWIERMSQAEDAIEKLERSVCTLNRILSNVSLCLHDADDEI